MPWHAEFREAPLGPFHLRAEHEPLASRAIDESVLDLLAKGRCSPSRSRRGISGRIGFGDDVEDARWLNVEILDHLEKLKEGDVPEFNT